MKPAARALVGPRAKHTLLRISALLAALANGACNAQGSSTCQPACADDKRECHALAQHAAKAEDRPLAAMNRQLPRASFHGSDGLILEKKRNDINDFRARRMQQARACDHRYMQCVRACGEPPADGGSVVLKPKDEL